MRITTFYWTGYLVKVTWKQDIDIRWQVKTHSGGQYIWQLCCEYHWWWISGRWGGSWCLWGGQFEEQSAIIGSAQIPFCYVVLPMKSGNCDQGCKGKLIPRKSGLSEWKVVPSHKCARVHNNFKSEHLLLEKNVHNQVNHRCCTHLKRPATVCDVSIKILLIILKISLDIYLGQDHTYYQWRNPHEIPM